MAGKRNSLLILPVIIGLAVFQYFFPADTGTLSETGRGQAENVVQAAHAAQRSGVWLETEGRIVRLLSDDNKGSRHQRFILDVGDRHTVMVAHNIDLAERVPVRQGDSISLRGQFEWNDRGGVIHWTHHDPDGSQQGGWIQLDEMRYE